MEEISVRYEKLLQAFKRLSHINNKFLSLSLTPCSQTSLQNEEDERWECRDSLIKRFEFCYDLLWKFFKTLLQKIHTVDTRSPRMTFDECYRLGLLTTEEATMLTEMIDVRNQTVHVYDENMAEEVSKMIPRYVSKMKTLLERLSKYTQ